MVLSLKGKFLFRRGDSMSEMTISERDIMLQKVFEKILEPTP
jgi:hypothetical protein